MLAIADSIIDERGASPDTDSLVAAKRVDNAGEGNHLLYVTSPYAHRNSDNTGICVEVQMSGIRVTT